MQRCQWCDEDSPLYTEYHDDEWGVPLANDHRLFEMLILEGMQAGLSWLTILKKRQDFRRAFDNFDPEVVSQYSEEKVLELLNDSSIIRNRLKIEAAIKNGKVFLALQEEYTSFAAYLWGWVAGKPIENRFSSLSEIPAKTELSEKISKDLKRRGMNFVGPTIIYAFMQAVGLVNDHETGCFRHAECVELAQQFLVNGVRQP